MISRKTINKSVATIMLIIMSLSFTPQSVQASGFPVFDGANEIKNTLTVINAYASLVTEQTENIERALAYARQIQNTIKALKLTGQQLRSITTGNDGGPQFITNYTQYLKAAESLVVQNYFRDTLSSANPFRTSVIRALESDYNSGSVSEEFNLDERFGEGWEDRHDESFSFGGWEVYTTRAEPGNNAFSTYLEAQEELDNNIMADRERLSLEVLSNEGFLPKRKCVDPPNWRPGLTETVVVQEAITADASGQLAIPPLTEQFPVTCDRWEDETPASFIENAGLTAQNQPFEKLNSDEGGLFAFLSLANDIMLKGLQIAGSVSSVIQTTQNVVAFGTDTFNSLSNLGWSQQPSQVVDLEKELQGYQIETDEEGNPLSNPIDVPGALELTQQEIDILNDILSHERYGIRVIPQKLLELDHILPGPDVGWEQRLREAVDNNKDFQKIRKKSDNDREWAIEDEAGVEDAITTESLNSRLAMADPDNTIPGYQNYLARVDQFDELYSQTNIVEQEIIRKNQTLGLLQSIERIRTDPNASDEDLNEAAQQYTRLREVTTPERLLDTELRRDQAILFRDQLDADLEEIERLVEERSQQDPDWGRAYNNKELFCDNIVRAIRNASSRRPVIISCHEFYDASLADYINPIR